MDQLKNAQNILLSSADEWMKMARSFSGAYESAWDQMLKNNLNLAKQVTSFVLDLNKSSQNCGDSSTVCPPEPSCPPKCLAKIHREASPGEIIVVPFRIKNACGRARIYQVNVRPLVDEQGKEAPSQPTLDRNEVHLEPDQSITLRMTLNLQQGFTKGESYTTNIVIREEKINQNVCFSLTMATTEKSIEVCPLDENQYLMRWSSWQDHFYCEVDRPNR